jgi:hypothetical protein
MQAAQAQHGADAKMSEDTATLIEGAKDAVGQLQDEAAGVYAKAKQAATGRAKGEL